MTQTRVTRQHTHPTCREPLAGRAWAFLSLARHIAWRRRWGSGWMAAAPPLPFFGSPKRPAPSIPPLTELALDALADNPSGLVDLRGIAEHLIVALLGKIMERGRLDYRLACLFRDAGHRDLADAMRELDLFAAVPSHNSIGERYGGCR